MTSVIFKNTGKNYDIAFGNVVVTFAEDEMKNLIRFIKNRSREYHSNTHDFYDVRTTKGICNLHVEILSNGRFEFTGWTEFYGEKFKVVTEMR